MSDTSGLQGADAEGVPAEERPERFEGGDETGVTPEGREDVTPPADAPASEGAEGAEPPPAEFDPAQQPSNPDLVEHVEPPD